MKYIYPHLGLGDFFICNGMLRKIIRDDEEYLIFSHKQNLESLKFMFRDLKNINFISGYQDYATNDNFVYEYILKNKIQKEDIIRITLTNKFMSHSFDENFYLSNSIDFNERWNNFKCERDFKRELIFFEKFNLIKKEYIFVHDDNFRNFNIRNEFLKNKKVIRPIPELTKNVFDYLTLIENAKEIHCMDSSFRMMIDSFNFENELFFHTYCRPSKDFAKSKLNWKLIN